ncbi:IclR family transcriptional regulator [Comamonadaceae bacterium G21597-S1]|nr:IclR family transcriptional regulator [Comamonadaceae bacterium G21597-S1]
MNRQPSTKDSSAPAVERTIDILHAIGSTTEGLGVQALAAQTRTPRATLYRILKVLLARDFVQLADEQPGLYRLGPALGLLAGQAPPPRDLVELARPVMQRLALSVGETVKLVVLDGHDALTVAVADTGLEARVMSRIGTRVPLHIGVSQRLLLAHQPANLVRQLLAKPLEKRTAKTITDPAALRASLEALRRVDSAQGQSEGIAGVGAAAALLRGAQDEVLGALVAVYIHTGKSVAQLESLRTGVERAAQEISSWRFAQAPRPGDAQSAS